ncbi:LysE family translocator [Nocardia veterana]|uniref:LysE family translocator n=1 Tax=Nocardia veterana TaxID=132249 RepID=A0A7X6RJH7_9NOCA|nr:LysE family translocator [Nocardia veterana]NKY88220.1 LysE family translocator [Nocardia veterana]
MASHLLAFTALAALLVVIPGPAVVLTMKNALVRGRPAAVATACGVLAADLVWAMASVAGLTALLAASHTAFGLVRIAGAAYLLYLAVKLVLTKELPVPQQTSSGQQGGLLRGFREGLLCDLSNPKTVLVFASVIPQFLAEAGSSLDGFLLGVVFAGLGFCSLLGYAFLFGATRSLVSNARLTRNLLRAGGAALGGFGVALLNESRA